MRRGEVAAANSLTFRIGKRIAAQNRIVFADIPRGSREMWGTSGRLQADKNAEGITALLLML